MKKNIIVSLLSALALVLVLAVAASAAPSSYTSGFQVQNLSDTDDANVVITYYNQNGSVDTTANDTIGAGTSTTYYPIDANAGFNGSVVISSDQAVAAIVNILGDGGAFGGASYNSFSSGSANANIPLVLSDFFNINTFFNVQNTGASDVTVNVDYSAATCTDQSATIAPGAAHTFDQTSDCSANTIGAATVTSDGEIAVAVVQYDDKSLLAYNGFTSDGAGTAVAPLVSQNYFNSRTALQVQNTGAAAVDVTVNFTPSPGFPGAACSQTLNIAPAASANFGDSAFFNNTAACDAGSGWVGGAEIDAGAGTVVAIVNSVTTGTANGAAYSAFDPSTATNVVNFPLVMDRNFGIFTGSGLASADGSSVDISCTFSNNARVYTATGTNFTDVHLNQLADGYVGASTCTATGPIVGVLSQLGGSGDKLLYYEGFNN
ncbi:MAG: hypothetical protein H6658_20385 [Ardenticatenaceae bacterium]|nr:hypothetical protein [Ardenticatenaceae bacterium]